MCAIQATDESQLAGVKSQSAADRADLGYEAQVQGAGGVIDRLSGAVHACHGQHGLRQSPLRQRYVVCFAGLFAIVASVLGQLLRPRSRFG